MTTGGEWAIKAAITTLCNVLGMEPEKVKSDLAKMMQIIVGIGEQLNRIEAQNLAIMRALNITAENANGNAEQRIEAVAGPAEIGNGAAGTESH